MENNREILLMQEAERKRIAQGLHDNTVQEMVCLFQKIELALQYMDRDIVQTRLELVLAKKQIGTIIDGIRDTIYTLRPMMPDDIGYKAAFDVLHDKLRENGFNASFDIDDFDTADDEITAASVFYIANEACQNVIKHSHAKNVSVSIKCQKQNISVTVADDGIGFDGQMKEKHFGLSFMQERVNLLGGEMAIASNEFGTTLNAVIPINGKGI